LIAADRVFEGIGAERGIAWRLADSLALRRFVGIAPDEYTPDHSTISRTRRLIDLDTHREVFGWVLGVLADGGLLQGQRIINRPDNRWPRWIT
jgi:transposase